MNEQLYHCVKSSTSVLTEFLWSEPHWFRSQKTGLHKKKLKLSILTQLNQTDKKQNVFN